MFRIKSQPYDESMVQIQVFDDKIMIMNKLLNLDINDDKTPTFSENGYKFSPDDYCHFLNHMAHNTDSFFAFDSDECEDSLLFDGMYFYIGDDTPTLIFTTSINKVNMSVHIPLQKCFDNIMSDLDLLFKTINTLICNKLDYLECIEGGEDVPLPTIDENIEK